MNLYQLRYFVKLAHLQYHTNAAGELHITRPNLTHAIHGMEEELDICLFEKKGRNATSFFPPAIREFIRYLKVSGQQPGDSRLVKSGGFMVVWRYENERKSRWEN